jgi:hypothetical protein
MPGADRFKNRGRTLLPEKCTPERRPHVGRWALDQVIDEGARGPLALDAAEDEELGQEHIPVYASKRCSEVPAWLVFGQTFENRRPAGHFRPPDACRLRDLGEQTQASRRLAEQPRVRADREANRFDSTCDLVERVSQGFQLRSAEVAQVADGGRRDAEMRRDR